MGKYPLGKKLPEFRRANDYGGEYPAKLWISKLESDFEIAGYDIEDIPIPPPLFIRAFEVLLCGDAAIKMLSNHRIQRIMDNRTQTKIEDVQTVKSWLISQYPIVSQMIPRGNLLDELRELSQQEESLETYFERAHELLKYTGSRDQFSEENGDPAGPRNEELRLHVLNNTDSGLTSLRRTYEVARNSVKVLETRNRNAKERMEGQNMRTLEEEMQRMRIEMERADSYFNKMGISATAAQPQGPRNFSNQGRGMFGGPDNFVGSPTSGASGIQNGGTYPALKPRSESLHPIINGTESFGPARNGLLCVRCGEKGHTKVVCRNKTLPYWERAYLAEKVKPQRNATAHLIAITEEGERSENSARLGKSASGNTNKVISFDEFAAEAADPAYAGHKVEIDGLQYQAADHSDADHLVSKAVSAMAAKRRRVGEAQEDEYEISEIRTGGSKKAGNRQLKTIVGRMRQGPLNYIELAKGFKADINLLDLMQASSEVTRQFRHLGTRQRSKKKSSKGKEKA
ncbi:hypothetical protein EV44_g5491 [Erysiphe necator]|uniref:CCHC-type domain-containing protein n=1 Tax=Uncinula necator TaxID=52586 RepID=A0A0B1NWV2_UNCNE|nr:hypothetical protein EV44_g5491 [Erysiphe necator]